MANLIILTQHMLRASKNLTKISTFLPNEAKTPPKTKQNVIKPSTFIPLRLPAIVL